MTHLAIQSNCCCTPETAGSCCNIANEENWSYKYFFSTLNRTYRYDYGCNCNTVIEGDPNLICPEQCSRPKGGCNYTEGLCDDSCFENPFSSNILICNGYSMELYASGGIIHYPTEFGCPPIPKGQDFPCICDLCPIDWELNEPKFPFLQNREVQYISPEYVLKSCPNHPTDNNSVPICNLPLEDRASTICLGNINDDYLTCLCSTMPPEFRTRLYGTYTQYISNRGTTNDGCNSDGTCGTWSQTTEVINFNILAFAQLSCGTPTICGETPSTIFHTLSIIPYVYGNNNDGYFYVDAETLELIPIFYHNNDNLPSPGLLRLSFFANLTSSVGPETANWIYSGGPAVPFDCPVPPSPFPDCSNCGPSSCEGKQTRDSCFSIADTLGWNGSECIGTKTDGSPYVCCCRDRGDECLGCYDVENEIPTLLISSTPLN